MSPGTITHYSAEGGGSCSAQEGKFTIILYLHKSDYVFRIHTTRNLLSKLSPTHCPAGAMLTHRRSCRTNGGTMGSSQEQERRCEGIDKAGERILYIYLVHTPKFLFRRIKVTVTEARLFAKPQWRSFGSVCILRLQRVITGFQSLRSILFRYLYQWPTPPHQLRAPLL